MSRWGNRGLMAAMSVALVANALLVGGATGTVAASDNETPLADAGLDQSVSVNTTVYLDATGSRDPDGEITQYEWEIERPDGNYTTPDCETCGRTSFVVRESGTYNATVTITDDDGATSSDTLRVNVSPSDGPTVTLSGPDEVVEGGVPTFSATVDAGETELMAVTWRVDGRRVNRTGISGDSATVDHPHAFSTDGEYTVRVVVTDQLGRQGAATKNVTVRDPAATGGGGSGGDGGGGAAAASAGSGDSDGEACARYNRDDDLYCNNDRMTMDSNGITISDADNDGTTEWGGVTIDQEFAENHEGVSYDSTDGVVKFESKEDYKDALKVDSVNVDPESELNQNSTFKSIVGINRGFDSSSDLVNSDQDAASQTSINAGSSGANSISESNPFLSGGGDANEVDDNGSNSDSSETNTRTGRVPPGRGPYR